MLDLGIQSVINMKFLRNPSKKNDLLPNVLDNENKTSKEFMINDLFFTIRILEKEQKYETSILNSIYRLTHCVLC